MRSWVTDTGEVVKEESPMGLLVVRETPEQAQALAVPGSVQADLLEAAALVPLHPQRIDDPRTVAMLRVRIDGLSGLDPADLDGAGQTATDGTFELRDARDLAPGPEPADLERYLHAETFLESDAPEIRAEAEKATVGADTPRLRAERLTRHVHAIVEKRPTVSLPSALEVLKTRIGDCNEHTALYVAMARSIGLPARIAAGLVYLKGAFYYHAWPEVFVTEAAGRGLWLPVDPTLNQFPADATHLRLARGGLDKQAAIVGLVGRAKLDILGVELRPGAVPVLVGRRGGRPRAARARHPPPPAWRARLLVAAAPVRAMIAVESLVKTFGSFRAVDGVSLEVAAGRDPRLPRPERRRQDHDDPHDRRAAEAERRAGSRSPGKDLAREPEAAKRELGFIPDRPFIYEKLTAAEFLRFHGGLYGLEGAPVEERAHELLDLFELTKWRDELVESFSHGMKQRLVMCSAFLHRPAGGARGRADGRARPARRPADQGRLPRDEPQGRARS